MADVRPALLDYLRADDKDAVRATLAERLGELDLPSARIETKNDPASALALARVLGRMLLDGSDLQELTDTAKAAAQRAPKDATGHDVVLLAGEVLWRIAGSPAAAEPYYRRVRRIDPSHPDVLAFYRTLFADEASATQLNSVLVQARRGSQDPQLRFELAQEIAELSEQRLGSPDRAIETWRAVLREDGYDARASAALMRLYRSGGKWTALVDLLKDEIERLGDAPEAKPERIEKLLEVARIYREHLHLPAMALATLQRILEVEPQHEPSLDALAATYGEAGRWSDLLGVYARQIDAAKESGDEARQIAYLRRVAELWIDRLANPQRALEPLGEVLAMAPKDPQARALLARIHEQRRDFRALIALRREELADLEGEAALALRIELAKLAEERLGDRREAIVAWNEVLEHHGDVDHALAALARLYERESRWANAAEILHRKLAHCNAEEALPLLNHLGGLYSDRIQSREDAIKVWSELLRLAPGHDRATRRLRDAYVAERRWDELTALFESQSRLPDVVEVLQSAADRIGDVEERVALYRRVAALCQDRLGEPERALKALERTLAIQPDNLEVARELLPIYREQANWARLSSTYEVLLKAARDDDERLALIASLREIAEDKLQSPALTLQWCAAAYRIRPTDLYRREALETAAQRADGWDELTAIYEERIAADGVEEAERLELLGKLAVIARDHLFKPDEAQRYFKRIIAIAPRDEGALDALEEIYSSTRRWDDLSEVVRRRLDVVEDRGERLRNLRKLASILEEHLADLDGAVAIYHAILEIEQDDRPALTSLARIHRNRGSWADLAVVLRRQLELAEADVSRVPLLFELADMQATRLREPEAAVEGFLTVLEIDPRHGAAVEALENLRRAEPNTALAIMRGLLPYYRRIEDRAREAEAMEVLVAAEAEPEARHRWLEQLAHAYEKMPERREDALRIRSELFRANPGDWQGRHVFQRLGAELGRTNEIAGAYDAVLAQMTAELHAAEAEGKTMPRERTALRRDLLLEYAAMLRDDLQRPAEAERAYRDVLALDETHQGAYEALEGLLRARQASGELVALYRRRVDVTFNPREQRELLSRIVQISRFVLHDRTTAVETAEELLDLIPDDLPTISMLAEMYADGAGPDDHAKLEDMLGRQAELSDDPEQARSLRVRRAELRMRALGDLHGAVDLLGQVLGEQPGDGEARALLEELLGRPEVQLEAGAVLEPIYVRFGEHAARIRVLDVRRVQAERQGTSDEAVGYLHQIAQLRERELQDPAAAFEAVREAFFLDASRIDSREELERLGLALGRGPELADAWTRALGDPRWSDLSLRIDLRTRLARLYDVHLQDQEAARAAYSALLELDPPDARLAIEAVQALCRLHLEAGDGPALVEAKRRLLRFTDAPAEHVRIRLEIAELQEDLGDRRGAAVTYGEVLDMQPANVAALDALERLFADEGEWERLVEVLEHRVSVTADPRHKAAIWRQIGELRRDHLEQIEATIDAFQSILDLKVGREETAYALAALVALHERRQRWPDVEEGLRRLIAITDDEDERIDLLVRMAVVVGRHLARPNDALDWLKRVLDMRPTDPRARKEVARHLEPDETRERALKILTPLYEAEQNWPALLEIEELQARKQPSGRRRLQALLKVAQTQEERLGDASQAFRVLCEAMAEAADQPELEAILTKVERLGSEGDRAEALLAAYEATVERILDAGLQQRVLRNEGKVALERLGRLDVACRAYERVLELSPDDRASADALEQIYLRQDAYEPLAELLVARADRSTDGRSRDDSLIRAAEIYRAKLGESERAIRLYERLSAEGLEREEVQRVIEPLYEATGRWPELASHLNRKLAHLQGNEAVETHLRLGRLYGQQLEDPQTGIRHLSAALKLDPNQAVANEELGKYLENPAMRLRVAEMLEPVFTLVGDWNRLIQIQEIRLAEAPDEATRGRILLRIAQIEEEQLEDLERAMNSYERLFRELPRDRFVRDQLARLASVLGQTERFAELLTAYVQGEGADDNGDEMLAMVREAANLWSGHLRRPARAVPLLQRVLAATPDDPALFVALEAALSQAEMWPEMARAYWNEAEHALSEERQIDLLRKLATLATELLEDPMEAARAYRRMLEIRPDYELARTRLEQQVAQLERWDDLLELLRERLLRTEGVEARADVALRIAHLQDEALEDPDGAADTLETMLSDHPDHPRAVEMLEHIAQARRALRPRVLAILRPIYERHGNLRRLVEIDEWQLAHTDDPEARHALYREISDLLARSSETIEAAFRTLCRALAEPGPADALESLDEAVTHLADALGAREALSDAMVIAADAEALEGADDRRIELLVRAAQIKQHFGDPAAAVEILRRALQLRDSDPDALALLDAALSRLGYHDELASVLHRRAEVADDDHDRIPLLRRLARLYEEVLARPEEAEQAWKALLELEPSDREALQRLSRVYEASGSTPELIRVLERRIEGSTDADERRDLRMHLASLQRETLRDRSAEIDTLRALLVEAPSDDDALAALGRALVAEERHAEAADVLHERATLATADERRAALMLEAARIYAGPLGDLVSALERYEQVLALQPGQEGATRDLIAIALREEGFETAGNLVIGPLEAAGRHGELAEVLAARARFTADPEEKVECLRRLAHVRLDRLDDPAGALQAWLALLDAVDEAGLPEVLRQSGKLAVQLEQGNEHLRRLAERAGSLDLPGSTRLVIAAYAADLAEEVLGEPREALHVLVPLLEGGLATPAVCERVERLGRALGDHAAVERALREASRLAPDRAAQAHAWVRLGEVQLAQGNLDGALEAYREAYDVQPGAEAVRGLEAVLERSGGNPASAVLDALEVAYQASGDRGGGARVLRHRLEQAEDDDRLRWLEPLALLQEDGGGTPAEALETWGELLDRDPDSRLALDHLLQLGRAEPELLPRAVELMQAAQGHAQERGRDTTALSLQIAAALLRELAQPAAAMLALTPIFAEHPEHPEALALLVDAARRAGDGPALHEALVRYAALQSDPNVAVGLWSEAAAVAETTLGDPRIAIADLEALLGVDDGDEGAWQKMMTLLRACADYERLVAALGRRAAITEHAAERRELRYRLANVLVDKLDRPDDAIAVYQDMLAEAPEDREAMGELEVLLHRLERWDDVRDLLERKLDLAEGEQRVVVLEEMAQLAESKLKDTVEAIERYGQVLREYPEHRGAEAALERLLTAEERWVDLSELYQTRLDRLRATGDVVGYRNVVATLSSLLAERLGHPERARDLLDELLAEDPNYVPALLAKAAVYDAMGEEAVAQQTLEYAAGLHPQGRDGAALHLRLAQATRGDVERRKMHLETALALDPGNGRAAAQLLELARQQEQWEQVTYLLELVAARADDPVRRRDVTLERVDVCLLYLGDAEGALRILAPLYKQVQDDVDINRRIADALFVADRLDEAAGMYNWLVEVGRQTKRNKVLAHYLTRLARIALRHEDLDRALEQLLEAYRIDTTNVETLLSLGDTHERLGQWRDALNVYRTMLIQNADQTGRIGRGEIYLKLARAHLNLREEPKARTMLRRGIEEDPGNPELGRELAALGG